MVGFAKVGAEDTVVMRAMVTAIIDFFAIVIGFSLKWRLDRTGGSFRRGAGWVLKRV
jgi:hypothetical protein